jgi:hypothetical protein
MRPLGWKAIPGSAFEAVDVSSLTVSSVLRRGRCGVSASAVGITAHPVADSR